MKSKANFNTKKFDVKLDENYFYLTGIDKNWNLQIAYIDIIEIINYIVKKVKTSKEQK